MTGHSERVLTEALRTKKVIKFIVQELKEEMSRQGYKFLAEQNPYKIYSVVLLTHSTQITCSNCVKALIAEQVSRENGSFLGMLTEELNEGSEGFFKAHKKEILIL